MADTPEEIAAFVTALRTNQCAENMGCGVMPSCACSAMDDAADIIERQADEIAALRAATAWRPIAEAQPGAEIVRWHKVWRCPVAVTANAGRLPEHCEWITCTRDQSWPEEAFTPHWTPLPSPPAEG